MIPYAPQFTLNNGRTVFFGEILSHDAFLRVLKAYTRQRYLDLLIQAALVMHYEMKGEES